MASTNLNGVVVSIVRELHMRTVVGVVSWVSVGGGRWVALPHLRGLIVVAGTDRGGGDIGNALNSVAAPHWRTMQLQT